MVRGEIRGTVFCVVLQFASRDCVEPRHLYLRLNVRELRCSHAKRSPDGKE
jgi:hypothetical protein